MVTSALCAYSGITHALAAQERQCVMFSVAVLAWKVWNPHRYPAACVVAYLSVPCLDCTAGNRAGHAARAGTAKALLGAFHSSVLLLWQGVFVCAPASPCGRLASTAPTYAMQGAVAHDLVVWWICCACALHSAHAPQSLTCWAL